MKLELSHIAIACSSLQRVAERLQLLSLKIAENHSVPTEKVQAAMIPVGVSPHFRIELLEPTSVDSPISKFLEKRPDGGIHHVCFEVQRLEEWKTLLEKEGIQVLPPGIRKAARGKAIFLHPKSMGGVLVELEEISS